MKPGPCWDQNYKMRPLGHDWIMRASPRSGVYALNKRHNGWTWDHTWDPSHGRQKQKEEELKLSSPDTRFAGGLLLPFPASVGDTFLLYLCVGRVFVLVTQQTKTAKQICSH